MEFTRVLGDPRTFGDHHTGQSVSLEASSSVCGVPVVEASSSLVMGINAVHLYVLGRVDVVVHR